MLFSFHCPTCKGKLEADASLSGAQSACPQCGNLVAIPEGRVDTGTTLAGFHLERRLGKGGMGEVYLARQLSVDRQVAVKILPPGFAADQQAVARFLQEGRLAARLDHHHIVTVHEAGEDSGNYYMAMAYVEGESLDQRLKRDGALPETEALTMVRAVADALAYAWDEFQLLHRDLKPANIMLDRRGRVFLMDLGLAKSLGDGEGLTLSGTVLGTPQYMSPEQAQGLDLGVASDIYSLGATLYHLVTGAPPFTGDSLLKILNQHVHEPLPPPRGRNPRLSEGCNRLIETMLAKKPEDRPRDWRTLVAELDRLLAAPGTAVPPPAVAPSVRSEPPVPGRVPPKATAKAPAPSPKRRLPAWQIGLATVGVLLLVVLAAVALRGRRPVAVAENQPPVAEPVASPAGLPRPPMVVPAVPVPGQAWTVPELGMEFVPIAPGSFQREGRSVQISRAFWLGKYEVTEGEYKALTGRVPGMNRGDRYPVDDVAWVDALAYCRQLNEQERSAGRLPDGYEYRLPTEAEWEYACRAGDGRDRIDNVDEVAWHKGNSGGGPHEVGTKKANAWGLHDMHGNAYEHCRDSFAPGHWKSLSETDPVDLWLTGDCVIRGCATYDPPEAVAKLSFACPLPVDSGGGAIGFRVCLGPVLTGASTVPIPRPAWDRIVLPSTGRWGLQCAGQDNYVAVPNLTWKTGEPLTIELVFTIEGREPTYLAGREGSGGMWLAIRDGVLWARSARSFSELVPNQSAATALGWGRRLHVASVRDGRSLRLYVNGQLLAETLLPPETEGTSPVAGEFSIGRPGQYGFRGTVETMRVSRRALYAANFDLEQALPLKPGKDTLCLLDFEEGEGEVAKDSSGNKHDGQIHGATWKPMWPCPVSEARLREVAEALSKANPKLGYARIRVAGLPDALSLDLSGNRELVDIGPLQGLPIASLELQGTGVQDLSPLRGMPLRKLNLTGTPVADLSPLRGLPLMTIGVGQTQVRDLSPLSESPLASFYATPAPITDLSPIAGCPLRVLILSGCGLQALPVFTARRLQVLKIDGNPITDLAPLAGLPLVQLSMNKAGATDLTPLRSCPNLNWVSITEPLKVEAVSALLPQVASVVANATWTDFAAAGGYSSAYQEIFDEMFPR